MLSRRLVISALALGFLVPTAANAQTKMVMSGKHRMYCCDAPAFPGVSKIFLQPVTGAPKGYGAGLAKIYATVSATGASNKTLLLPTARIGAHAANTMATPMTVKFKSLSTMLDWYNAAATLAPGGSWPTGTMFTGGSTWSFCPSGMGPGVGSCVAPSSAGPPPRNGRIVRKAGASKFGGTMNLLGGSKSKGWRWAISTMNPLYFKLYPFVPDSVIGGAPGSGTSGSVKNVFNTTVNMTQTSTKYQPLSFRGAGPWGTGMVTLQVTMNAFAPLVTVGLTGSDMRNASGVGSLQLVSGVMFNGIAPTSPGTVSLANMISVTLPEPEPALGVSAAALGLALVGVIRARRQRQR